MILFQTYHSKKIKHLNTINTVMKWGICLKRKLLQIQGQSCTLGSHSAKIYSMWWRCFQITILPPQSALVLISGGITIMTDDQLLPLFWWLCWKMWSQILSELACMETKWCSPNVLFCKGNYEILRIVLLKFANVTLCMTLKIFGLHCNIYSVL